MSFKNTFNKIGTVLNMPSPVVESKTRKKVVMENTEIKCS